MMLRALGCFLLFLMFAMPTVSLAENGSEDAFGYEFTSIDGAPLSLNDYRGQPVLVVNTASLCGFTYQYDALQALWEGYRDRGFVLVGVPSNDFGGQEPGSNQEIKTFCETNFAIDFPMTEKVHVHGPESHPLFDHFRHELGEQTGPNWNFHKYLIAPNGKVVAGWPSRVKPQSEEITSAIEALLPEAS